MNDNKELVITATRSEYKGHGLIVLSSGTNEKYPFQFGLQKAQRILASIDAIRAFVRDEEAAAAAKDLAAEKTKTVAIK